MKTNYLHIGDCLDFAKSLPDKSVDCVITSPPYWQLRDYGYPEQWGLEPTYQEYLEHLWSLMDEIWRVLKDTGTVWINLGDTYNSTGKGTGGGWALDETNYANKAQLAESRQTKTTEPDKCLLLIPHRFAIGCIERGWIMRNDCIWAKRNGMPESVTDRFSKKHEYFFFMTKKPKYFFDLDAVRDECGESGWDKSGLNFNSYDVGINANQNRTRGNKQKGKNPGDVSDFWDVPTKPSKKNHFATYNNELIDKPIKAGCPKKVCSKCGAPVEKIIESEFKGDSNKRGTWNQKDKGQSGLPKDAGKTKRRVVGETDCGCNAPLIPGIIYDPFAGTGTTLIRAYQLGRRFIGSEGSPEYDEIFKREFARAKTGIEPRTAEEIALTGNQPSLFDGI